MVQVILTQCITLDTQTMTGIYVMLARAGVLFSGTALLFLQAAETLQMDAVEQAHPALAVPEPDKPC